MNTFIKNVSLSCEKQHKRPITRVLSYREIADRISGEVCFDIKSGFSGSGVDALDAPIKLFLGKWATRYSDVFTKYQEHIEQREELSDYKNVRNGALFGIGAGVGVGVAIDGYSSYTRTSGIGWEISARALPALIEAFGIFAPFWKRIIRSAKYKAGLTEEKPESLRSTEIWALWQLAGPVIGTAMLVLGEKYSWNANPTYKALAVVTLNTGNNVLGAFGTLWNLYKDARAITTSNKDYPNRSLYKRLWKSRKDDFYLALCNFMMDKFQSSNAVVAASWYSTEQILRNYEIAAENVSFGGSNFGGKTLASLESGLLSCDTPVAAWIAMIRLKAQLAAKIKELTSITYLDEFYVSAK
ncbi:hypothetical protein J4450_04535 [Candidatus Micrarchaeota archaeon]|nr:hypothetical protein [Candidatus Micrarchaeota archaeon]